MKPLYVALCTAALFSGQACTQSNDLWYLDQVITQQMKSFGVPGLAIAVVQGDQTIYAKGFGTREVGKNLSVDADTLFAIGSTSKAFTGLALGLLVQDGKLNWDDKVTKHIPDFEMNDPVATKDLMVRDLVANRSGISANSEILWFGTKLTRNDIVKALRYIEPDSSIRTKYAYRNAMFIVAGQVIEAVSGEPWEAFVKKRILQPLHMERTVASITELPKFRNIASPHLQIGNETTAIPYRNMDIPVAAGGLVSSVNDMAQWLRLQLGAFSTGNDPIVASETLNETHTPHIPMDVSHPNLRLFLGAPQPQMGAYALGWVVGDRTGKKMVVHNGAIDGMQAFVGLVPSEKIGVVVLTNYEGHEVHGAILQTVIGRLLKEPYYDYFTLAHQATDQAKAAKAKEAEDFYKKQVRGTKPSLALEAYAGSYHNDAFGTVQITSNGNSLQVSFSPELTADLQHFNYDVFVANFKSAVIQTRWDRPSNLSFEVKDGGNPTAFIWDDALRFERVY